jgi:hypothetical protein
MFAFSGNDFAVSSYMNNFYFDTETIILLIVAVAFSMPVYRIIEGKLNGFCNQGRLQVVLVSGCRILFYAALFIISASFFAAGSYNPFIYFRF